MGKSLACTFETVIQFVQSKSAFSEQNNGEERSGN